MKSFKVGFIAACGLMILLAASLAPMLAEAQSCPIIQVECSDGRIRGCSGVRQGDACIYKADCLNCRPYNPN